ncbi:MAG: hypothetical protein IIZ83_05915 [Oscillospiraceae bacterium]|nr:hypothetical protein [Oscillospiraceae bacterium]
MDDLQRWEMLCDVDVSGETIADPAQVRGAFYRTKSTRSGDMLELDIYPLFGREEKRRLRRHNPTPTAMANLNRRNAEKKFRRLAEINFRHKEDYYFTGTISPGPGRSLPTLEQVNRLYTRFIRRVNYRRKKLGLGPCRHMGVIEGYEEGSRMKRLHVHALIEGGLDRDTMEALWGEGMISQCRRLEKPMLDQLCAYLLKDPRGRKRWRYSRNLERPKVTVADRKITARAAWRLYTDAAGRAAALERIYKGYTVEFVEARTNPYMPGVYIAARLWKGGRRGDEQRIP